MLLVFRLLEILVKVSNLNFISVEIFKLEIVDFLLVVANDVNKIN